jgi:hypothetical protein
MKKTAQQPEDFATRYQNTERLNFAEYRERLKTKTEAELLYIIKDASEAAQALPNGQKCGYYQDEVHEANRELRQRRETARKMPRVKWEDLMMGHLEYIAECTRSDAQGMADAQHEAVKQAYDDNRTPEEAARLINFYSRIN